MQIVEGVEAAPAPPGAYWIEPGRLLAGAHPAARTFEESRRRLEVLIGAGVSAFLDLTEEGECAPYAAWFPEQARSGRAVNYVRKPLPDHSIPQTPQVMTDILETLEDLLADGHCVYVHCRAGIGRTGMVAGCHLIRQGMAPEAALEHLQQLWRDCGRSVIWPHTPETEEQTEYVRRWGQPPRQRRSPWRLRWFGLKSRRSG